MSLGGIKFTELIKKDFAQEVEQRIEYVRLERVSEINS
jgi:hypothetical protein